MKMKQGKQCGYLKHFQAAPLWLQSDYNSTATQMSIQNRESEASCVTHEHYVNPTGKKGPEMRSQAALTAHANYLVRYKKKKHVC